MVFLMFNQVFDGKELSKNMKTDKNVNKKLEKLFKGISKEIQIFLFTDPAKNESNNSAARLIISMIMEAAPDIKLEEFNLEDQLAHKFDVKDSPTLLINPERFNIRWVGAPAGEEIRSFIEALRMIGLNRVDLGEHSKKIIQSIEGKCDIKIFTSPNCPYCPIQAINVLKAAINKPELISLEIIDVLANPEIAEKYGAFSVPQTFANENLIAHGAQSEELFMMSLKTMEEQRIFIPESDAKEVKTDLVVIGCGPAGMAAGIYAQRSGLKTVIIERNIPGGQVAITPIVENYPGLTQVGGRNLAEIMAAHALEYVKIFPGEEVIQIYPDDQITVLTNRRKFIAKAVLLATGAKYRHLNVEGELQFAGSGVSYCSTCDGPLFKGKKVIVVGGGNSAVTEALHLKNIGVDVTIIHRRDSFRAQEHLVKNLYDNNVPIIFNTELKKIEGSNHVETIELYNNKRKKTARKQVDGVFISIGYEPAVELANKTGIELTDEGYIKHDSKHRTNIKGIYSAGDVEGGYKQIVIAAGLGAAAAMTIFEDLINP